MSTRITIILDIDGVPSDARECVNEMLDQGVLQDAIMEFASDSGKDVDEILSATIVSVTEAP